MTLNTEIIITPFNSARKNLPHIVCHDIYRVAILNTKFPVVK